ncbi:MAG: type I restriction-modification system subunit M N-terminal domain-containing protein, partial [Spirochaetales bacterium]|nr:type I restriction-modification system subunit M N-terminal domain-containing protein [Spirochaetales bacterium]
MAKKSENKATGNVGFEDQLWEAASILWGSMNPNLYQNIVLGLVFLKYISDKFEEKHKQLVEEGEGFEEDEDEY